MKQKLFGRLVAVAAVLLLSAATASAHSFEVDGIYYEKNSDGTSVSVTYKGSSYSSYSNEYSGEVTIPSEVAYEGTTYSVTSIGDSAFRGCSGLTSVSIGNSVISISERAFWGCSGLTSVSIGNSVTAIGDYTFFGCSGLTSVVIPNSVTSIGEGTFYECSGLTSVVIPNSVTSIGNSVFYGCSGLTSVSIGNSVTSIGNSAFAYCSGLTSVEIPNSVKSIGEDAFWKCYSLKSVEIPNSVTSIGRYAFEDCSGLTSVSIGNSVTSIGYRAFSGCSGLKLAFFNAKNCSIDNSVFSSSGLTLVIGADVEQIEGQLLSSNATKIVTQAATPPVITSQTFSDKSCPLYVPQGSYAKYWAADVWGEFTNIKTIDNLITKIELNKSSKNLGTNNITQLSATITPDNATLKDIYWVSDNPTIASVDQNGKVQG